MSKIYDDLKRGGDQHNGDKLDLFAYAARKVRPEPPPAPAPPPPPEEPGPAVSAVSEAPPELAKREPGPPQVEASETPPKIEPAKPVESVYRSLSPLTSVRPSPHEKGRRPFTIAAPTVFGLLILVFLVVGIVRGLSRARPADVAESAGPSVDAAVPEPEKAAPAPREVRPAPVAAAKPAKPMELGGKGMVVTAENNERLIVFEEGVFASGFKLSREGEILLSNVGRQLAQQANKVQVTVIGCADNRPVSGKAKYKSNEALGLMRAAEAERVLRAASGLPADTFKTVSYGAKRSPFPNDTAANRARNRTVVLRILFL